VKEGLIYLKGGTTPIYEDSDMGPPLRQLRYFYYLSGLNAANCIVTYDIGKDLLIVWLPPIPTPRLILYNGPIPTAEEVQAQSEVDRVERNTKLDAYLTFYAHCNSGHIYLLHDNQAPKGVALNIRMVDGSISRIRNPPFEVAKLQPAMNDARGVKSDYEIRMLRKANKISARGHLNVLRGISRFKNEAEIEAVFLATSTSMQAKMQSYGIIAGSGTNASTLHYMANDEPLAGRQLVCLDAGAEWKCYSSDVTRTFPISGSFTSDAKAIYDLVERMQEACIAIIKPGLNWARAGTLLSHKMAVEGLMQLGLLHGGDFDEIFKSGASTAFFPHGVCRI
jgi:Xaa-Pro dipeptidase